MANFTNGYVYSYTITDGTIANNVLPDTFGRTTWTPNTWTALFVHQHLSINPAVLPTVASGQLWPR